MCRKGRSGTLLLCLFLLLAGTAAGAKTIVIPKDYKTIQEGVDAAGTGDTVKVLMQGSPYEENILVEGKSELTLEGVRDGNDRPVIEGSVTIEKTGRAELSNFVVEGREYGASIEDSKGVDIRANIIRRCEVGVRIIASSDFRVFDNTFAVTGCAVVTEKAEGGKIGYNSVEKFEKAAFLLMDGSQDIGIQYNRVEGEGTPVYLQTDTAHNSVYGNLFLRFGEGPFDDGHDNRWFEASQGNHWEDWEENEGFEEGVYLISGDSESVDEHPFEVFQNFSKMRYLMLATPIHPEDGRPEAVVGDDFGGEPAGWPRWIVCRWDWKAAEYYFYKEPDTPDPPQFDAGRGFWVLQNVLDSTDIDVFGRGASQRKDFVIPLNPPIEEEKIRGLKQVGNPFPYTIDWGNSKVSDGVTRKTLTIEEAAEEGWVDGHAYTWDWENSQYKPVSPWDPPAKRKLEEWLGFWVEQLDPERRLELLIPPEKVSAPKVVAGLEEGWFLELPVRSADGKFQDIYNGLGIRPHASSGPDAYDAVEFMPPTTSYVQLYFPHDNPDDPENYWQDRPGKYTYDYRNMDWTEQIWTFEVSTNLSDTDLQISWPNIDSIPRDYQFCLEDLENGNRIEDLREVPSYSFNSGSGGVRSFRLIVSYHPTAVEEESKSGFPCSFALEQNIPNPFNAQTRIRYHLAGAGHVRLVIFSLWGQQVRVLVDEYKKAGSYAVGWDGRDTDGREMASGIYLYRIEVGASSQTRKMLLIR